MLKKHEIDMTEGVIYKQLLSFFFPLLGSSFFQQLYNTADALIVGRVAGKAALSAVGGSAAAILTIFIHFFINMTGALRLSCPNISAPRRIRRYLLSLIPPSSFPCGLE